MNNPLPLGAERIQLEGETCWIWETKVGFSLRQGSLQLELENFVRNDESHHKIDWQNKVPKTSQFEGGLSRRGQGHLTRREFITQAGPVLAALRQLMMPPAPPLRS